MYVRQPINNNHISISGDDMLKEIYGKLLSLEKDFKERETNYLSKISSLEDKLQKTEDNYLSRISFLERRLSKGKAVRKNKNSYEIKSENPIEKDSSIKNYDFIEENNKLIEVGASPRAQYVFRMLREHYRWQSIKCFVKYGTIHDTCKTKSTFAGTKRYFQRGEKELEELNIIYKVRRFWRNKKNGKLGKREKTRRCYFYPTSEWGKNESSYTELFRLAELEDSLQENDSNKELSFNELIQKYGDSKGALSINPNGAQLKEKPTNKGFPRVHSNAENTEKCTIRKPTIIPNSAPLENPLKSSPNKEGEEELSVYFKDKSAPPVVHMCTPYKLQHNNIQKNISLSGYIKKETFLENPLKEGKEVVNENLSLDIPLELKEQKIAEALAKDPATSNFFNKYGVCPVEQKQVKVNKKPEKLSIKRLKRVEAEALMDFLSKCYQYPLLRENRLNLFEGDNKVKARLKYYLAYIDNNDPFFESHDKILNVKNIIYYTLELILHKYYDCLLDEEEKNKGYYSIYGIFNLKNYSSKGKIGIEHLFDHKRPNIDDFNKFKARMIMAALCKMEESQRDYIVQNLNEHILPQENYIEAYESLGDKADFLKPLIKQEEEEKPEQYDPDDFSIMGLVKERFKAKTEVKEEPMKEFIMGMRKDQVIQKYKYEGKLMPKEVYSTLKASHPEIIDEIEGRKKVNKKRIVELFPVEKLPTKSQEKEKLPTSSKTKVLAGLGRENGDFENCQKNCQQTPFSLVVSTETENSNKNKKTLQEIDLDWVKKEHQKLKKNLNDGKFGAKMMLNMFENKHREVLDNVFD